MSDRDSRRRLIAAALLLAASLTPAGVFGAEELQEWNGSGFERSAIRTVEREEIYPNGEPAAFTHRLDLTLVRLEKTNWTDQRVVRQLRKTANIFAACEIGLGDVRLARVRAPSSSRHIDTAETIDGTHVPRDVHRLAGLVPAGSHWPLIFFVESLRGDSAFARSFQQGDVSSAELTKFPYMNTAWVAYKTHWIERRDDGYSTLAHEIAHLLCRCGHEYQDEPHLLHSHKNFLSTRIQPKDCDLFRKSILVRPSKVFESLR